MFHRPWRFVLTAALAVPALTGGAVWFDHRSVAEAPPAATASAKTDRERLVGAWELVEIDGRPASDADRARPGGSLTFTDERVRSEVRDGGMSVWRYRLNTEVTPKRMDWTMPRTNAPEYVYRQWIYKLDGDTLTLCGKTSETAVSDPPERFEAGTVQKAMVFSLLVYRKKAEGVAPVKFEMLNRTLVRLTFQPIWFDVSPSLDASFVNTRSFAIPFKIDPNRLAKDDEIRLLVSADRGRSWVQTGVEKASGSEFRYAAADDGEFWFAVHTRGEDIRDLQPGIKVVVDTVPPLVEVRREGKIVAWKAADRHLDPASVRVEYRWPGSSEWQRIAVEPAADGSTNLPDGTDAEALVRVVVRDRAGNVGVARNPEPPSGGASYDGPLEPKDVVRIDVDGAAVELPGVAGEHAVRSDGMLLLDPHGSLNVIGMTGREVAAAIRQRLADRLGKPDVRVRVVPLTAKSCTVRVVVPAGETTLGIPLKGGETVRDVLARVPGLVADGYEVKLVRIGPGMKLVQIGCDAKSGFAVLPRDSIHATKKK